MENRHSFGLDAQGYLKYRPRYPDALYRHLAAVAPDTAAALDCATGSGQAAVDLARYFDRVAAFDASPEQIAAAGETANVEYRVGTAEAMPFGDWRFDLVTVAQGAHWFDLPQFYARVREVAKPGAVIAIWGYSYCRVDSGVDAIVERTLLGRIDRYWAEGNRVIMDRYRSIEFPFEELEWPRFDADCTWTRRDYLQFIRTWSAVKQFEAEHGIDPVAGVEAALEATWPADEARSVSFELVGRLGRIHREVP